MVSRLPNLGVCSLLVCALAVTARPAAAADLPAPLTYSAVHASYSPQASPRAVTDTITNFVTLHGFTGGMTASIRGALVQANTATSTARRPQAATDMPTLSMGAERSSDDSRRHRDHPTPSREAQTAVSRAALQKRRTASMGRTRRGRVVQLRHDLRMTLAAV